MIDKLAKASPMMVYYRWSVLDENKPTRNRFPRNDPMFVEDIYGNSV